MTPALSRIFKNLYFNTVVVGFFTVHRRRRRKNNYFTLTCIHETLRNAKSLGGRVQ